MEVNLSGMVSGKEVQRPLDDEKEEEEDDDDDDDDVDGSRQRVDGLVFSQLVQLQKLYPSTTTQATSVSRSDETILKPRRFSVQPHPASAKWRSESVR